MKGIYLVLCDLSYIYQIRKSNDLRIIQVHFEPDIRFNVTLDGIGDALGTVCLQNIAAVSRLGEMRENSHLNVS